MTHSNSAPERLLTLGEVIAMTSFSRTTIYREIGANRFPAPVKIGRMSRWLSSDVAGYVGALARNGERSTADRRLSEWKGE